MAGPGLGSEVGVGVGVGRGVETLTGTLIDCGKEDWQRGGNGVSLGFVNFSLEGLEELAELFQFGNSVFGLLDHLGLRHGCELNSGDEVHGFIPSSMLTRNVPSRGCRHGEYKRFKLSGWMSPG